MQHDRARPATIRAEQDRALARYIRGEVLPYSAFYRGPLERLQGGTGRGRGRVDLTRLPLTTLDEVEDPRALVLRPTEERIVRHGPASLTAKVQLARVTGRLGTLSRTTIDPEYKPVHWVIEAGVPLASSARDVERLSELGRRWLEGADVMPTDAVVSVLPAGPHLPFWQLALGARRAGLSCISLGADATAEDVERLRPDVLVGRPEELRSLLEAEADIRPRLVLAAGTVLATEERSRLSELAGGAVVRWAWAPPGVRAMWAECTGTAGLHTWPDTELVEVVHGELVWTAIGWAGSALLRLATGVQGVVDDTPCPACGRTTPRVRLGADLPAFARALEDNAGVALWQAELRTVDGEDELIVFLAPLRSGNPGPLLKELTPHMQVTQFVVLSRDEVQARLDRHDGAQIVEP